MAYIFQHRRDTLANWNAVNPVLADAEIGFILDLDENGKQKSSLYKIGDGGTAWNDLPLFGFGGNVYDNFTGSDLNTSVASRQAVIDKIVSELSKLNNDIVNGTKDVEGLLNKLSNTQLVQFLTPENGEYFGDLYNDPENPLTWEQVQPYLENQIVSRWALLEQFQGIWNDFGGMEDNINVLRQDHNSFVQVTEEQFAVLLSFKDTFGPAFNEFKAATEATLVSLTVSINAHDKFINGWDEEVTTEETDPETGEPIIETIHHKGVDEKIANAQSEVQTNVDNVDAKIESLRAEFVAKHNILSEVDFAKIKDFTPYAEGTLFYTYAATQA